MKGISQIQSKFFFVKTWTVVCYALLCCGLLFMAAFPGYNKLIIVAAIGMLGLALVALSIHNLNFGFYGIVVFGFLMAFIDRMTGSTLPLYSVLFIAPFVLFLFLIIRCVFLHERFHIDKHPLVYVYFITVAYTLFQLFNPQMDSLTGWVSYFRQTLSVTALLLLCLYIFADLKSIRFFFRFLLGAILIMALYGCVQQWFGLAPWDKHWVFSDPKIYGLYVLPGGSIRKFSFLTDPANFGTLVAAGGIGTLILAFESPSKKTKIIWGVFTLIIFLGMSYSGTRTANIMIVSGIALYIIMTLYNKKARILAIGVAAVYLFIMNVPIYGNVTINRLRTSFKSPSHNASLDTRMINRQKIRPYLMAHPFGDGVNTTGVTGSKYNPNVPLAGIPPDSSLVAFFMENGWVGLAIHLTFLFLILAFAIHYFYRCHNREIKIYYAVIATMLFSLGLVGGYAQYTLVNVPQIFIYIPFIAITVKLQLFDKPQLSKTTYK